MCNTMLASQQILFHLPFLALFKNELGSLLLTYGPFFSHSKGNLEKRFHKDLRGPKCDNILSLLSIALAASCWGPVAQSCLTLCDPMDSSMLGFPVLHHLLELAQTHVHRVCDAIQPSHPLLSPSPPAFNLSQHQGLFQ